MNIDDELDQFAEGAKPGYKVPFKFSPLLESTEFIPPALEIGEPKRPTRKIIVNNAVRNTKPGLF